MESPLLDDVQMHARACENESAEGVSLSPGCSLLQEILSGHAIFLHDQIAWCAHAELINTHYRVSIFVPEPGDACLHCNLLHTSWKHLRLVLLCLTLEALHARHRHDTDPRTKLLRSLHCILHLRACCDDDHLECRRLLLENVATLKSAVTARLGTRYTHVWHILPRKDERSRSVQTLNGSCESTGGL